MYSFGNNEICGGRGRVFNWLVVLLLVCSVTDIAYDLFELSELTCFKSSERFCSDVFDLKVDW